MLDFKSSLSILDTSPLLDMIENIFIFLTFRIGYMYTSTFQHL